MEDQQPKTLILMSGGPDSSTLAKVAEQERKEHGGTICALFLRTGHASDDRECEAAGVVADMIGARLEIVDISDAVASLGGKAILIHSEAAIMKFGNAFAMSFAYAYAFQIEATSILVGIHLDDAKESAEYSRDYFDRIESLAGSAGYPAPPLRTPFIKMTKTDVIKLGSDLGLDYSVTWSCIRGSERHCGNCGACRARRRAFVRSGLEDPTDYATEPMALESAVH